MGKGLVARICVLNGKFGRVAMEILRQVFVMRSGCYWDEEEDNEKKRL